MESKRLGWCFKLKDGLKIAEPNGRISVSYLEQAKSSLLRAEKDLNDNDFLWATVAIYYAEYYALYSFLQKIGVKCENHVCSILAVSFLLGEEKTQTINKHKSKRIDAQYYIKNTMRHPTLKVCPSGKSAFGGVGFGRALVFWMLGEPPHLKRWGFLGFPDMKVDQEDTIREMLREAKVFVSAFDEIVSRLTENEIKKYIERIYESK